MPLDKPPYQITIVMETYRPDALSEALTYLDQLCSHESPDQPKANSDMIKASVTIGSRSEDVLTEVRELFEGYLRARRLILSGEVRAKSPLVRPLVERTPMEAALDELGDEAEEAEVES